MSGEDSFLGFLELLAVLTGNTEKQADVCRGCAVGVWREGTRSCGEKSRSGGTRSGRVPEGMFF